MRTLVDLPDSQDQAPAALRDRIRQPRAAVIRQAVAEYIERHAGKPTDAAFGLSGADASAGLDYHRKARAKRWIDPSASYPG